VALFEVGVLAEEAADFAGVFAEAPSHVEEVVHHLPREEKLIERSWVRVRCRANMTHKTVRARFWPGIQGKSP